MDDLEILQHRIIEFTAVREWDQFHSPKNLSMALAVEASELLEKFQWLTEEQSRELTPADHAAVSDEVADAFIYLLLLSDKLDIDLIEASNAKIQKNEAKYPVALARGSAAKAGQWGPPPDGELE